MLTDIGEYGKNKKRLRAKLLNKLIIYPLKYENIKQQ